MIKMRGEFFFLKDYRLEEVQPEFITIIIQLLLRITTQSPNEWSASISNHQYTNGNIRPFARATGKIISCFREANAVYRGLFSTNFSTHLSDILLRSKADATCSTNGSSKRRNMRPLTFLYQNTRAKQSKRRNLDVHVLT